MNRLDTICSMVSENSTVHDIGCDHAYLLLKLYPKIKQGFAMDIAQKPLNTAIKTINENNISDKIQAVLSNGLEKVDFNIADTIVIAGMGAELITIILSDNSNIYNEKLTFILQPMTKSELLRQFLYEKGFEIVDEQISIEERRFYTIIKAKFTNKQIKKDVLDCYVSEKLQEQERFIDFAEEKIRKASIICKQIEDTQSERYIYYNKLLEKMRGYI
ncbi:MAG: class I SAM-dependent methyltransferase [Clostridia bacterium]